MFKKKNRFLYDVCLLLFEHLRKYCRFAPASFVYPQTTLMSLAGGSVAGLAVEGLIQFDKELWFIMLIC
jgi:hypothetical protein